MFGLAFAIFLARTRIPHLQGEETSTIKRGKIRVVFIYLFIFLMNQMPYAKPIEFHVSFPPDFNGLWFWLLAPMKGPELSVLG